MFGLHYSLNVGGVTGNIRKGLGLESIDYGWNFRNLDLRKVRHLGRDTKMPVGYRRTKKYKQNSINRDHCIHFFHRDNLHWA